LLDEIENRTWSEALINGQLQILEKVAQGAPFAETLAFIIKVCEAQFTEMLCSVLLLDPDGVHIRHGAAPSLPAEYLRTIDGSAIGPSAGSCGTAAYLAKQIIVQDIATDPLWAEYKTIALAFGLHACWSTPIFNTQNKVIGTFAIYYRKPRLPTERHLQLIEVITKLTALAIIRHNTEAALRLTENRYARLVNSNIIGVIIADVQGNILEANDRFLAIVGYSREDLQAGLVRWNALTPPGWESVDQKAIEIAAATGVTGTYEKEYLHKSGHRVPVRVTGAMLETPKYAGIALIEDLTEFKRAEAERHQIFARISDAFVALDKHWCYEFLNAKAGQILGRSPESLIGKHILTEFPEAAGQKCQLAYEKAMAIQESAIVQEYYPPNDLWFENHIYPSPQGLSIYFHDITERKRAELKIREHLDELLRWQQITMGREDRIQNLKAEVNRLLLDQGKPPRYANPEAS
jgi:PAS domain S-box-containing protein